MTSTDGCEIIKLQPAAIIGFDGHIIAGLRVHPDQRHLVFPLGNEITVYELETNRQTFLRGHTNTLSTVDISASVKMVASGQTNHIGFRAYVIIWDWKSRKEISRYELHRVKVQSLCFSSNEQYLVSLGGKDCGSIIVWDIEQNMAICGTIATKETTGNALKHIDCDRMRLNVQDVVGKLRREFAGMRITENDDILYVGIMSGDIVKIRLNVSSNPNAPMQDKIPFLFGCFGKHNPRKPVVKDCEKYHHGVRDLLISPNGSLVIGAGDRTIEMVHERNVSFKNYNSPTWPQLKSLQSAKR